MTWVIKRYRDAQGVRRSTVVKEDENDPTVNIIDFGSHGGTPWRPTTSLDKLERAVRRALNKENT